MGQFVAQQAADEPAISAPDVAAVLVPIDQAAITVGVVCAVPRAQQHVVKMILRNRQSMAALARGCCRHVRRKARTPAGIFGSGSGANANATALIGGAARWRMPSLCTIPAFFFFF